MKPMLQVSSKSCFTVHEPVLAKHHGIGIVAGMVKGKVIVAFPLHLWETDPSGRDFKLLAFQPDQVERIIKNGHTNNDKSDLSTNG